MAKPGPKPKPTKLKVLHGNPGKRALNKDEPKPKPVTGKCPEELKGKSRRYWNRYVPMLERLGIATEIDPLCLGPFFKELESYWEARKFTDEHGTVYPIYQYVQNGTDTAGKPVMKRELKYMQQFQQVSIANKALQNVLRIATEYGFTASSRTRLTVVNESDDEEGRALDALLNRARDHQANTFR